MDGQTVSGIITSVVAGLITNGIQGFYNYITKETLQDYIINVIETTQDCYERKFACEGKSLFIWEKNIEYYTCWLQEGFLPRANAVPLSFMATTKNRMLRRNNWIFINSQMNKLVMANPELRSLHASIIQDDIYKILLEKEKIKQNPDYYDYVKSFGNVLFLHKDVNRQAITLKDTYVLPTYRFAVRSAMNDTNVSFSLEELLQQFVKQNKSRVMVIEGDAGVGKSSLISYLCYSNEKLKQQTENGIWHNSDVYCIRLRNLTMNKSFIEAPVKELLKELGLQSYAEYESNNSKKIMLLDGFDELCMLDGMAEFAESILSEIIRGFSDTYIVITTRPKFLKVYELREKGIRTEIVHISLNHFDASKREEWCLKYYRVCGREDYPKLKKIQMIDDETSDGICDTPLALYMLAAGRINDDAWKNPWVLYHQIFCEELSNTEYNKIFSDDTYTHSICKYNDILYRISAEIAYKMYQTGNKQLHILQEDIEKIIIDLHLKTDHIEQLVKRCYALCNYWKNDGKRGMAEFYHNNIRDFFLCEKIFFELEKIYRFFEPDCMADEQKRDKTIENFIARFGSLFSFSDFSDKVSEFIYYRSLYKMENGEEENFILQELKYQFLGYFFEKMFIHGAIQEYTYDGKRNLYQENINVLKCVVQIYRHIYEPYVVSSKKRLEWFFNAESEMSTVEGLPVLFKPVFIRTPLTISSDYLIPVAGYANFNLFDMKKADLRYGTFNFSKFLSCDFSDTILKSSDFTGAILKRCTFANVDLSYSCLKDADITDSKFQSCNLVGTTLPDGFCSDIQQEQEEHLRLLLHQQHEK